MRWLLIAAIVVCSIPAWAAGGSCPTGVNYLQESTNTLVTLSTIGVTSCIFVSAAGSDSNNGKTPDGSGFVSTSGTAVTLAAGQAFNLGWTGTITINSVGYTISTVNSATSITLTGSAGTQMTVSYTVAGTPFLHAPGMTACSSSCASFTMAAGIGIIFRPGDHWHLGNSGSAPYVGSAKWTESTAGSSLSSPVYVGTDPTWASGSGTRWVLDGDNGLWTSPNALPSSCPVHDFVANAGASFAANVIVENLEVTGACSSFALTNANPMFLDFGNNDLAEFIYYHGWQLTASSLNLYGCCTGGSNVVFTYLTVDGSDSPHWPTGNSNCTSEVTNLACATGQGIYDKAWKIEYSVFRYTANHTVTNDSITIHDTLWEYLEGPPNVAMSNAQHQDAPMVFSGTLQSFYNNVTRHNNTTQIMYANMNAGATLNIFNNVWYDNLRWGPSDTSPANCMNIAAQTAGGGQVINFYNNTVDQDTDDSTGGGCTLSIYASGGNTLPLNCTTTCIQWNGTINAANNHLIGSSTLASMFSIRNHSSGSSSYTLNDLGGNITQVTATARSQGYLQASSPIGDLSTTGSGSTIGAGTNETGSCSTFSSDSALCSGTSGAASGLAGDITFPTIAENSRGSSWDAEASQFASVVSYTLSVAVSGSGSVSSVPAGIAACTSAGGANCSASFASGTGVILTATPNSNYGLKTWATAGCGVTGTCTVTMTVAQQASAIFVPTVPLPPQAWVDPYACIDGTYTAPTFELNLATQAWVGTAPGSGFHLPYWTVGSPTVAGLQSAWSDLSAYRAANGEGFYVDVPDALTAGGGTFSGAGGAWVDEAASTAPTSCIIVRSVDDAHLPTGRTVCAHGIQDNLSTSLDPGLENPDCAGDAMSYQLGSTVTAVPSGSFTFANGNVVTTSSYNDKQYMWTLEGSGSSPTALRFCAPVGGGSSTSLVPSCTSTTLAPQLWFFEDMEVRQQAGDINDSDVISMPGSGSETTTTEYPTGIGFAKDWCHGDWTSLAAGLNSTSNCWDAITQKVSIVDSQASQLLRPGSEGHVVLMQGNNFNISHNWFEGQSIGFLSGGNCAAFPVSGYIAAVNGEERDNRFTFPWAWLGQTISGNAHWNGSSLVRKNGNELKAGVNIVRDGNIIEKVDPSGGQGGVLGDVKTVNDSCGFGTNFQNKVENVTDSNNIWRHGLETFELVRNPGSVGGVDGGIRRYGALNSLFYDVNETNFGGSENQGFQINQQAWAWQGTLTENANGTATFVANCSVNQGLCIGQIQAANVSVSGNTGAGTITFSAPNIQGGMLATGTYNSGGTVTMGIYGSGYTSGTCTNSTGGTCSFTPNASSTTPGTGFTVLQMQPGDAAAVTQCSSVTSFNQPVTSYPSGYLPSGIGPPVIAGVTPLSLTTSYAWPTATTPAGSSDSAGYCKLTNMQGFPQQFTLSHVTAVQNSTNGLTFTNGYSNFITNGPNFMRFASIQDSIISNGGITNSSGIGCCAATINFNTDTTTATHDHMIYAAASGSYTGANLGNNPFNPVASPILYFPTTAYCTGATATSSCIGFAGSEYYSASSMNLDPADYHDLGIKTGTYYAAGGTGQASDGTNEGALMPQIDAAETLITYVCPVSCPGPGPYPRALVNVVVNVAVTGNGTVTDNFSEISCPSTCNATYAYGTTVVLTAAPSAGYVFAGWSGTGGCTGTGTCTLTLSANPTATFVPISAPTNLNITNGVVLTQGIVVTK